MNTFLFILYFNKKESYRVRFFGISEDRAQEVGEGMTNSAFAAKNKNPGVLIFKQQEDENYKLLKAINKSYCGELFEIPAPTEPEEIPMF